MWYSLSGLLGLRSLEEVLQLGREPAKSTEPLRAANLFDSFGSLFIAARPYSRRYVAGLSAIARFETDSTTCWSES